MAAGQTSALFTLALAAALSVGCQTAGTRQATSHALAASTSPLPAEVQLAAHTQPSLSDAPPPVSTAEPEVLASPSSTAPQPPAPPALSLFDAVELGLAQNPDLVALRYSEAPSEGALGVAQTYPFNPWVQIQVTPSQTSPTASTAPTNHYVLLMQQLQLAHQRQHRTAAAASMLNAVRWNFVQAKLLNIAQTQRLYFTALYQRELADLARANSELNNQLLGISQKQFEGGTIAGADVAILKLDNAAARRQAALAAANYQTALLDLKRQLALPASAPLALCERLTDFRWLPLSPEKPAWSQFVCLELPLNADRAWLAHALASGRPDVWAANADVETARANLDLARASRVPDLIIGPYYQRNNDPTTFWGLRAQMDLPVVNTGAPLVRQRLAELTQRNAIWEQLLRRATLEAEASLDRYDRAMSLIDGSEHTATADLPDELERLERQFRAGEVDLVRVVTARTSFFQARRSALDNLSELAQASANVVASTGLSPQSLLSPTVGQSPRLP